MKKSFVIALHSEIISKGNEALSFDTILLIKIIAAQNEAALSYRKVRGLYFLAVIFAATITIIAFNTAEFT